MPCTLLTRASMTGAGTERISKTAENRQRIRKEKGDRHENDYEFKEKDSGENQ